MKNNAIKLLTVGLIAPLMIGCNNKGKTGPTWSSDIVEEMELYLGEVLPFVELNEETIYHGYDNSNEGYGVGTYYIGDDNDANLVADYGTKLEEAGWSLVQDDEGEYYTKEVNDFELSCFFDWYEASDEYAAGNEIVVYCPVYVEPVTEEALLAAGYTKVNGWPASDVLEVLTDAYNIGAVNATGEWFVSGPQLIEGNYGDYYGIFLATHSDVTEELIETLEDNGYYYDEDYLAYFSSDDEAEIDVSLNNGFTLIDIYGPYLVPDVTNETTNADGSIDVSFTFASALTDGTSYANETIESTSASLNISKGNNDNNAPTYYSNGDTLRCYYKNTLTITAATGLTINSVTIEVGSVKNQTANNMTASSGTLTSTGTTAPATVTISGVNASTLTINIAPEATKGNIGISSITVNVSSAQ
ncbi:MAG: hypothetical protein J5511_02270 [Bacilli bacterium]|nr:hypothetical protein [Bacilli bacterium]